MTTLTFLNSNGDLTTARKLLIIQSGSYDLLAGLIALVRKTYPEAALTVLLRRGIADAPAAPEGVEYLENLGSKADQVRKLRARAFDGVFVLYSNDPGYWKLKLLPFALGARAVLAVNEHLGWFAVTLRDLDRMGGHLLWRLGSGSISVMGPAKGIARAAATPAVLGYLLAYERLAGLRAQRSEYPPQWKGGHRTGSIKGPHRG